MYYKRARLGTRVRVIHDIDMAAAGTIGFINELCGYNRDAGGKIIGRWVTVWCESMILPDGRYSARKNIAVSTECLEEIK